jgi:hypothetical protein
MDDDPKMQILQWRNEKIAEQNTEIARLQLERDQIELDLIQMAERNERLRAALDQEKHKRATDNVCLGADLIDEAKEIARLRAALEEIANRLPEKWPDQVIASKALAEQKG